MKVRFVVALCLVLAATTVVAQEKKELKTQEDKFSYALGLDMGHNLKKNNLEVDTDLFVRGLKDALSGEKALMTQEEMRQLFATVQKDMKEKLVEKNKKEGDAFLAKNKNEKGVRTLPSGLQYKIITEGKGKSPKASETVTVNYRGTLIDGTEFDSSYKRGMPATFPVSGVIKGWTEALQLMKEGGKWQLFIPANLAYGESGRPGIPPNSVLIFEVELLSMKK